MNAPPAKGAESVGAAEKAGEWEGGNRGEADARQCDPSAAADRAIAGLNMRDLCWRYQIPRARLAEYLSRGRNRHFPNGYGERQFARASDKILQFAYNLGGGSIEDLLATQYADLHDK